MSTIFGIIFGPSGVGALPLGVAAELSIHYFGAFLLAYNHTEPEYNHMEPDSFCATYFSPIRGCPRVMKFCMEF